MAFPANTILQVGAYRYYNPTTPTQYQLLFRNIGGSSCILDAKMNLIITKEENDNYNNSVIQENVLNRLRDAYNGKILKHITETSNTEEILITNISGWTGSNIDNTTYINPQGGVFPSDIVLDVVRGYNNTPINNDDYSYSVASLYIDQSSTTFYANPQDNMSLGTNSNSDNFKVANGNDSLTLNSNGNIKNLIKQAINESIILSGNTNTLSYLKATISEIIRLTATSTYLSKNVLPVIINEFIVLRSKSDKKTFFNQLINETIHMFNSAMCYDYLTTFRFCNEFLILKDADAGNLQAISKVLEVILNDFILFRNNSSVQTFFNQKVLDNIKLHEIFNTYKNSAIILSDNLTLDNYSNTQAFFKVALIDYFKTSVLLNFNEELYEVYSINLENKALTRYDNYEFNSFASLKNKNYGMKKDGIYDLNDKTSNAELLLSSFKTGYLNSFSDKDMQTGIDRLKEVRVAYFKLKNDGSSIMRVYKDDGEAFDYIINANYNGQQFRTQFGRDLSGSLFQIEFDNTGSFDLYDGKIEPIILKRRV